MQPPVYGRRGMVISGHPLATMAGWSILERGGSAADAAVAAASVLTVTLPQAVTIGGDCVALVHDAATGSTLALNATGHAPFSLDVSKLSRADIDSGPMSPTVPGLIAGWASLHERFGRLPWASLIEPAAEIAAEGFPVSRTFSATLEEYKASLSREPSLANDLLPDGAALREGAILRQTALSRTLLTVAHEGPRGFYEGAIAKALTDSVRRRGGALELSDLANFIPEWTQPLSIAWRGHEIAVVPPNSYGLLLLLQMKVLGSVEKALAAAGPASPERLKLLVGAGKASFQAAERWIADPRFVDIPVEKLLHDTLAPDLAPEPRAGRGGTAVVSVVDKNGNAITIVQSVFTLFGSFVRDTVTGVLLNNRMRGFSLDPAHANCIAPGKRPAHTLSPAMVLSDGKPRLLLGTPGGPGQTITIAQVLVNRLLHGLPLNDAITAPRWSFDLSGNILVENSMAESSLATLAQAGVRMQRIEGLSPFFGSAEAIELMDGGIMVGAADARREALVLGA